MQKAELEIIQKSAEPLPIRHNDGIRWQNDSQPEPEAATTAAAATAVEGAVEERVLGGLTSEPITNA